MFIIVAPVFAACMIYVVRSLAAQAKDDSENTAATPARRVAYLGLMTAVSALLQGAPIYWPAVGQGLAVLTSLPVALGVLAFPVGAVPMVVATAGVLMLVHVKQAVIFVFTTAPVGLTVAWAVIVERPLWQRLLLPGIALGSGMLLMAYATGIAPFGPGTHDRLGSSAVAIYVLFSVVYGALWVALLSRVYASLRSMLQPGRGGPGPGTSI